MEFKKRGELIDYSKHSFKVNTPLYVTVNKKVHTYCRLGGDIYTNQLTIKYRTGEHQLDFVYLDKAIDDMLEKTDSIIEEVLESVLEIVKNQLIDAEYICVTAKITDSVPKDMPVEVTAERFPFVGEEFSNKWDSEE